MTLDALVAKITDPYERNARLYPALIALLPLLGLIALLYAPQASAMSAAVTIAVSCGGLYLLTNISREFGKRLEGKVLKEWGGKPSTQLLRFCNPTIDHVTKGRYHAFLADKIHHAFPTEEQERDSPEAADEVYRAGVQWLLNHTRPEDNKKFELLLKESVSYGFRRNALGMKPLGLAISIGCALSVLATSHVFSTVGNHIDSAALARMAAPAVASLTLSLVMTGVWLMFVTKATMRTAAYTYAEMLLRGCEVLSSADVSRASPSRDAEAKATGSEDRSGRTL